MTSVQTLTVGAPSYNNKLSSQLPDKLLFRQDPYALQWVGWATVLLSITVMELLIIVLHAL